MDKEAIKKALKAFHLHGWDRAPKTLDMDKWLRELLEENERLQVELAEAKCKAAWFEREQNAYRKALEWYADETNHEMVDTPLDSYSYETTSAAWQDSGKRARQALRKEQTP